MRKRLAAYNGGGCTLAVWTLGICRMTVGCSFWTAIFFEWKRSAVHEQCLAVSSNFLHEVLATLSRGFAILDAFRVAVCYIVLYHLFSFRKYVQDYIVHMDMEIVIFVGIKG